jgi:hypothetical protein
MLAVARDIDAGVMLLADNVEHASIDGRGELPAIDRLAGLVQCEKR